jgi:hypothetical protein
MSKGKWTSETRLRRAELQNQIAVRQERVTKVQRLSAEITCTQEEIAVARNDHKRAGLQRRLERLREQEREMMRVPPLTWDDIG